MNKINIKGALDLAVENHTKGKLQEAEILYRKILEIDSNNSNAVHLLGLIAHQLGKYNVAVEYIERAIELNPNSALYYGNLAMAYDKLGNEGEAAKNFKKALEINPNYEKAYLAHYNLGVYYMDRGLIKEALEHYDKSIALDKDFYEARWNRSLILLLLGRFKEGWREYGCRFKKESPSDSREFNKLKWNGESLAGKRILVLSEQGFGDNIQFTRYIPLIKERGGRIIFECGKELRRVFQDFPGIDELVEKKAGIVPDVDYDFYIHLMSLPQIFNTNLGDIPKIIPLMANPELIAKFQGIFKKDDFNIGIAWAGNPEQANDKNRSMSFEKFKILKGMPKVKLFSLQKGKAAEQLNDSEIINLAEKITDFADTAAIIENLDLVISVDTSVAHLAGAMGKQAWTLLTFLPDWRWLLNRGDSPWYQSMKLFRQDSARDWDSVLINVKEELARALLGKKSFL